MSRCIFPYNERLETVCKSMIETIKEKALLLDQRQTFHKETYGPIHNIPPPEKMSIVKMKGAVVNSDTCNSTQLTSSILVDKIEEVLKVKTKETGDVYECTVLRMDCHHHVRNVWIGVLNKHLSTYLNNIL